MFYQHPDRAPAGVIGGSCMIRGPGDWTGLAVANRNVRAVIEQHFESLETAVRIVRQYVPPERPLSVVEMVRIRTGFQQDPSQLRTRGNGRCQRPPFMAVGLIGMSAGVQ